MIETWIQNLCLHPVDKQLSDFYKAYRRLFFYADKCSGVVVRYDGQETLTVKNKVLW